MILIQRPRRRIGMTMASCVGMLPILNNNGAVFIAGEIYPSNYINILSNFGVEVEVSESYSTPRMEPIYDNVFAIEPNIIGFTQKPKKITGYILTKKNETSNPQM